MAKPVDFPLCPTFGPSQFEMSASNFEATRSGRLGRPPTGGGSGAVAPYFIGMQHAKERARYARGIAQCCSAEEHANSLMGHGKGVGRKLAF